MRRIRDYSATARLGSLLVAVSVLASVAASAAAQDWKGRGRLQGIVLAEDGEPLGGASVTLTLAGRSDSGPQPITSNARGRWSYLGLKNGAWTVLIEHSDYVASEGSVSVRESGSSQQQDIRTQLRRLTAVDDEEEEEERAAALRSLVERGNSMLAEGRFAEARQGFESALAEVADEVHPLLHLAIARTYYQEGKVEETLAAATRALVIDPQNVDALRLMSSLLVSEGRGAEAQEYLARLPQEEKLDPNAFLNLGIEKYNDQDLNGALVDFDAVVRGYPDFADAYYYRGLVHLNLGNNALSAADFRKLLEIAPDHPKVEEVTQFLDYLEPP